MKNEIRGWVEFETHQAKSLDSCMLAEEGETGWSLAGSLSSFPKAEEGQNLWSKAETSIRWCFYAIVSAN